MTLAPTPYLDNKHTIFGRVSSGMRVAQRLGAVATDAQDKCVHHPTRDAAAFLTFIPGLGKTSRSTKPE
ncbi:hypothetical protein PHLCEN_2v7788 [Hermanssonia centrifuga]|uniref:PPIase cyclophilin-type domain-containing protein n=1 Tax=Hermanssonia centrifuga TaxID=98765 RepID=A0A2R6NVI7_9APHY|nr:hypothetical protein PHLCEN_2v7788 [Hermanssonia centrifuga]